MSGEGHLLDGRAAHWALAPLLAEASLRARVADAAVAALEQHRVARPVAADPACVAVEAIIEGVGLARGGGTRKGVERGRGRGKLVATL